MDFFETMSTLAVDLSSRGFDVLLPAAEEIKIDYTAISDFDLAEAKSAFIDEHLGKIRVSDAILVVNLPKREVDGYVGANTLMEMAFAYALGRKVFVLYHPGDQPCRPELLGMKPNVLDGDLSLLRL